MRTQTFISLCSAASMTVLVSVAEAGTFSSFSLGSVNGQQGWTMQDSFGNSVTAFNQSIKQDGNGNNVFQMSNAVTNSSYSNQVFSNTSSAVAGESSSAALYNNYGTNHLAPYNPAQYGAYATDSQFSTSFSFRSATGAAQSGLSLTLSASAKQSTVRMTWLQLKDTGSGFNLEYFETQGSDFVAATLATGLSYTATHDVSMTIDFVAGVNTVGGVNYGNDVLKIYLGGQLIKTGTTWESYYYANELTPSGGAPRIQAVNSMLLRSSGTAAAGTAGNGFYFSDFTVGNAVPAPGAAALIGLAGLVASRRRRN